MSGQLIAAGDFLIQTCFDLYITAIMLRFLLQLVKADFYNPVSQFLITVTNPVIIPLRRIIPGYAGIDISAILLMLLFAWIKLIVLAYFLYGSSPNIIGLFIIGLSELGVLAINIYFFSIIILAIISWINPMSYNPILNLLHRLVDPLLSPIRRVIPPIGGLDISPLFGLMLLQLINILVFNSIGYYGQLVAQSH